MEKTLEKAKRLPTTFEAYAVVLAMVIILAVGSAVFGMELKVLLLFCAAINQILAYRCGYNFEDSIKLYSQKISDLAGTLVIMLLIGFVIGTWMLAGTAPALVCWLSSLISPKFILVFSFLLTGIMSSLIGSSFATMGTLGVVMFSTAIAQGIPAGMAAAAVICGANIGQFISPLADVVSFISGLNKISIYRHIKNLVPPVIIACVISLVFYFVAGMKYSSTSTSLEAVAQLQESVKASFNTNPVVILPLVIALVMCFLKVNPAIALFTSGVSAMLVAVFIQHTPFSNCIDAAWYGFDSSYMLESEVSESFAEFLNRGGSASMADGILFILVAMLTMSILEKAGVFEVIQKTVLSKANSVSKLAIVTSLFASLFTVVTCDSYTTSAVMATSLRRMYVDAGYNPEKIASLGTAWCFTIEQIMPWSFIAVYSASVYGVQVLDFVPGCIFYYALSIALLVMTICGYNNERVGVDFDKEEVVKA